MSKEIKLSKSQKEVVSKMRTLILNHYCGYFYFKDSEKKYAERTIFKLLEFGLVEMINYRFTLTPLGHSVKID